MVDIAASVIAKLKNRSKKEVVLLQQILKSMIQEDDVLKTWSHKERKYV